MVEDITTSPERNHARALRAPRGPLGRTVSYGARKEKWERYARVVDTASSSKRATFALTAEHTLDILGDRRSGRMLDIGCGFGEIAILLADRTKFNITNFI